jgi:hypothetical protein
LLKGDGLRYQSLFSLIKYFKIVAVVFDRVYQLLELIEIKKVKINYAAAGINR